jgi:uncharacterized protein YjdB
MRNRFTRWIAPLAVVALALTACEDGGPTEVADGDLSIELKVVSGSDQSAIAGTELSDPLVVKVERMSGWGRRKRWVPKPHQLVNFVVVEGGGTVFAGASMTNWKGIAQEYWTLGPEPGLNVLEVRAVNPYTGEKQVFATFEAWGLCEPVATVTVAPADAGDDLLLQVGETVQLSALLQNEADETLTGCEVEWKSSTVSDDGLVTAVDLGDATITATSQGTPGSADVTVQPVPVFSVEILSPDGVPIDQYAIDEETVLELTAKLEDVDGNELFGRDVVWTSSDLNGDVVTLSPKGTVTQVAPGGPVTITATSEGVSDAVTVTVNEPPPTGPVPDEWEFNDSDNPADFGQVSIDDDPLVFRANFHSGGAKPQDWYKIEALLTPSPSCVVGVGEIFDITVVLDDIPGPVPGNPEGSEYDMWLMDEFGNVLSYNWEFWQTPETNFSAVVNASCAADDSEVFQIMVQLFNPSPPTNEMYSLTVTLARR